MHWATREHIRMQKKYAFFALYIFDTLEIRQAFEHSLMNLGTRVHAVSIASTCLFSKFEVVRLV